MRKDIVNLKTEGKTENNEQGTESIEASKGKSKNHLSYDDKAEGDHSTFKRDDNNDIYKYQEWKENMRNPNRFDPGKRFDGGKPDGSQGAPHVNKKTGETVETPHVNDNKRVSRKPEPWEFPDNNRFKTNE
ncbi:MAG: hypothetical protein KF746_27165 [Chitinophagaceae bacterium]|nr:hypothetical protein [Chitinophagaceae bacterium]